MIKGVLPFMRRRRAGRIINITSMGGYITMPGIAYYCGSKSALETVSETLSNEVIDFGIRVTAIAPGQFRFEQRDFLSPISGLKSWSFREFRKHQIQKNSQDLHGWRLFSEPGAWRSGSGFALRKASEGDRARIP